MLNLTIERKTYWEIDLSKLKVSGRYNSVALSYICILFTP